MEASPFTLSVPDADFLQPENRNTAKKLHVISRLKIVENIIPGLKSKLLFYFNQPSDKFSIFTTMKLFCLFLLLTISAVPVSGQEPVTPNQFEGTDSERIQQSVEAAAKQGGVVRIPLYNSNGSYIWKVDKAILLPGNITVLLDNCTIQLSDSCRDNMFRSSNVGEGITSPGWLHNIALTGIGKVVLKGADNPRSTGDGARRLTLDPDREIARKNWRVSYGADAAYPGRKQTGDWRNIMILIAQVEGFTLKNLRIENTHAWAVSFERTHNAEISDISFYNPEAVTAGGHNVKIFNRDGIDLLQGCKNFRINNISGFTGDDFIALSSLSATPALSRSYGSLESTMLTKAGWYSPEDDIEQVFITNINCESICKAIAIRASDSAGIHHVYINGLMSREVAGQGGKHNALLIGGKGYGGPSLPGKINNIYAMNIMATGHAAVLIEAPVADCHFMNIIYNGKDPQVVDYTAEKQTMKNVTETNLVKSSR
jgi:polygalacturonase